MSTLTIETPGTEALEVVGQGLVARAKAMTVRTVEEHGIGLEFLRSIAGAQKAVKDLFAPSKRAADVAHKEIVKAERSLLDPLEAARGLVGMKCATYTEEERRKAQAETLRLKAIARKEAEDRALAEAQAAEEAGDKGLADEILSAPAPPPPPVHVAPKVAELRGVYERETWSAEVVDKAALVRFVAEHFEEWSHLLDPVMPQLNGLARAQRDMMRIPGVRAVRTVGQSVRS